MSKQKLLNLLDYIPLVILTITAIILIRNIFVYSLGTAYSWKHVVGLIILPANWVIFAWNHKLGVLSLGGTMLLGLLSLLSYDFVVNTHTIFMGFSSDDPIPVYYGQLSFLPWAFLYAIISGRHYHGIATKKYWQELLHRQKT